MSENTHREAIVVTDIEYGESSDAVRKQAKAKREARHEDFLRGIIRRRLDCIECYKFNSCAQKICTKSENNAVIHQVRSGKW
jgi:hypothetical protein